MAEIVGMSLRPLAVSEHARRVRRRIVCSRFPERRLTEETD
ncbi:MAG TPA: hypothetical protein VEM59_06130 [Acidimicrobiia bacterium]|nr:hypothetical protein [Acidimicrobiia bacterium]